MRYTVSLLCIILISNSSLTDSNESNLLTLKCLWNFLYRFGQEEEYASVLVEKSVQELRQACFDQEYVEIGIIERMWQYLQ